MICSDSLQCYYRRSAQRAWDQCSKLLRVSLIASERLGNRVKKETLLERCNSEKPTSSSKRLFSAALTKRRLYTRSTRRIIALIGMLNFATVSILCTLYPSVELITFIPPAHLTEFNLFWGFIKFPINQGATVAITTGHIALTSITILGAIIGFYFTPAGRK